jgi:hypothetical protein
MDPRPLPPSCALIRIDVERSFALRVSGRKPKEANEDSMLYTIAVILLALWLLGFIAHVGGGLIHLLLVIAVVVIVYRLVTGQRAL